MAELREQRITIDPAGSRDLRRVRLWISRPTADEHVIELVLHKPSPEIGAIEETRHLRQLAVIDPELVA